MANTPTLIAKAYSAFDRRDTIADGLIERMDLEEGEAGAGQRAASASSAFSHMRA